jgi:hypothetical protein
MRPHFPRPFAVHHSAALESESELCLAEARLGASHPLVQALDHLLTARRQLVAVTAVQAGGLVLLSGSWRFGLALAVAAAVVQAVLCCRLIIGRSVRQDRCRELIIAGGERLALPSVGRLRASLLEGGTREQLASSIEELVRRATNPPPGEPRPLADARVIRATAPELRGVAALLRENPSAQGVALVEWLLTSAATPLYGADVDALQRELGRAHYLLACNPRDGAATGNEPRSAARAAH